MNSFGIMPVNFLNAAVNDDLEPSVKAMSSKVNRFLIIVVLTSVCKIIIISSTSQKIVSR